MFKIQNLGFLYELNLFMSVVRIVILSELFVIIKKVKSFIISTFHCMRLLNISIYI